MFRPDGCKSKVVPLTCPLDTYNELFAKHEELKQHVINQDMLIFKLREQQEQASIREALAIDVAKSGIRKELEAACFKSDLERVEAQAKLEAYENTKNDRDALRVMLDKSLTGLIEAVKTVHPAPSIHVEK